MRLVRLMLLCVVAGFYSASASAQSNVDGMTLIGMAEFSELRRPYYVAAFYADLPSSDADLILETQGRRRMEMRVTAKRWSPRRFSTQWTQAVLINNPQEELLKFDDTFVQFNNLVNESFVTGDHIVIDSFDDGTSTVSVNGVEAFSVARPGFLELLLGKWIGPRPPSTEFKSGMLGNYNAGLESTYQALVPTVERVQKMNRWFAGSIAGVRQETTPVAAVPTPAVVPTPTPEVEVPAAVEEVAETIQEPVVEAPTEVLPEVTSEVAAVQAVEEEVIEEEPEIDPELYARQQETLNYLYQSSVAKRILRNVKYPKRSIKRDQQDKFEVDVTVDRAGNVASVVFVKESRYGLLNKAATEAIEVAGKMPPVPPGLDGESITIRVPFSFRLQ